MITDSTERYVLTAVDDHTLLRYDRRWRRTKSYEPTGRVPFRYLEGAGFFLLVTGADEHPSATVRDVARPETTLATARWENNNWSFSGDKSAFGAVPEYVVLMDDGGILRIADDVEIDPLEKLQPVNSVIAIPGSRLVVLTGGGFVTIYDPIARRAGYRFKLAGENPRPCMRFRHGDKELWINDRESLLKLETRDWTPIDAAGSSADDPGQTLEITAWDFALDETVAVVGRRGSDDVVVVDAETMAPLVSVGLPSPPRDVLLFDDLHLIAARGDREGFAHTRLKLAKPGTVGDEQR